MFALHPPSLLLPAGQTGQPFEIPIGQNLPPGRSRVQVDLESGPGGHLVLTRSLPGVYERCDVFEEQPPVGLAPAAPIR